MKNIDDLPLKRLERKALQEIRERLLRDFQVSRLILYGSVVRGEADEESDVDLLVVLEEPLPSDKRRAITDMVFDVNLRYGTSFSALTVDRQSWDEGPLSVLPFHEEVVRGRYTLVNEEENRSIVVRE